MNPSQVTTKAYQYLHLAGEFRKQIATGLMRPGERLASVRTTARNKSLSLTTVMSAYSVLESEGLIEARRRSGYFVRSTARQAGSLPASLEGPCWCVIEVNDLMSRIAIDRSKPGLDGRLSYGFVDIDRFPNQKLMEILNSLSRRNPELQNQVDLPPGNLELRRQISRRYQTMGLDISPTDILITTGATEALNLGIRAVVKPGATVAVESPTYFAILQILENLGAKVIEIPGHPTEGMGLDCLEKTLNENAVDLVISIPTVNNPTGSTLPIQKKEKLVKLLEKRGVPLLEDDTYGDLAYGFPRPLPAKFFDKTGNVILCSSTSKTISPGFRLGWCIGGKYQHKIHVAKDFSTAGNPRLTQLTLAEYLRTGNYDKHLRSLQEYLKAQTQDYRVFLNSELGDQVKLGTPSGAYSLWVELPEHLDSSRLYSDLLKKNIQILPGLVFGGKTSFKNYVRINCGFPLKETRSALLEFCRRVRA